MKGLDDERSGLFVDSIKLVHRLRKLTGKPRYFVWENVPGAFITNKGHDFRAVLEEICQTEIPMPVNNKWAESGMVEWGGTSSLAWRTFDSQFWGSAQRRKRIFLVADFRGFTAGEILFERKSSARNIAESEGKRQKIAKNARESTNNTSELELYENHAQDSRVKGPLVVAPTVSATYGMGGNNTPIVLHTNDNSYKCRIIENHPNDSRVKYREDGTVQTLTGRMGTGGGNVPMIQTIAIEGNGSRPSHKGNGYKETDKMYTLNATEVHGVATNNKSVRRLTPIECERLQMLPDEWSNVEFNGKPAPDSKRYKAIGNGMAQCQPDWIMKRISEVAND
jgi:DNA (cytosine-5)-methyltransferase 1